MARRRNKKQEDFLAYPVTPDRQLTHPSGWCMTSDHAGCKYQFNHGKCGCECHLDPNFVKVKTETVVNDSQTEAPPAKRRGRPKGSKNKPKEIVNG